MTASGSTPPIAKPGWRNRIVGYAEVAPTTLQPNPMNWRTHPRYQALALQGSMEELGWIQDVIVNQRSGRMIDGHLRVDLALAAKEATVPVKYVDLTDEEEKLALATLDPITAWATADKEKLAELLRGVEATNQNVLDMLERVADNHGLLALLNSDAPEDPGADPEQGEALQKKWGTAAGQLWLIPSGTAPGSTHRLLCGDATLAESYQALMGDRLADMVFTDPPYNVNYVGKTANKLQIGNDNLQGGFYEFLRKASECLLAVNKGVTYICMASSELHTLFRAFVDAGGHWSTFVIWAKQHFTLGRSDYQRQYEPILYGWKEGTEHYWCGARDQGDVWPVDRPAASREHPTMKPVELVERAIRNSSKNRDIVLDAFTGSGTTFVAAERLGRTAYGLENDPRFVAVTLERLSGMRLRPVLNEEAA